MTVNDLILQKTLPDKPLLNALEIAKYLKIRPHVIRYWESEFGEIKAKKVNGQRLYKREDMILFQTLKILLLEKKFTIASAKKIIGDVDAMSKVLKPADEKKVEQNAYYDSEEQKKVLYNEVSKAESEGLIEKTKGIKKSIEVLHTMKENLSELLLLSAFEEKNMFFKESSKVYEH